MPQKTSKQIKGQLGEDAVCAFLTKKGHTIIARNYHKRCGEIDIISQINGEIVFIEVKTRKQGAMVSGAEAVNAAKRRKIILTADLYLSEHPTKLQPRFDVAEVEISRGEIPAVSSIVIYESAFTADGVYTFN